MKPIVRNVILGALVAALLSVSCTKEKPTGPPPPAIEKGAITVISTPAGAAIWLDNVSTGFVTPHTFDSVTTGSHSVKLELAGYNTWTDTVTVLANQTTTVNATLIHEFGHLAVTSTPSGAMIYLDGDSTNYRTPHIFSSLPTSTYHLRLTLSDYQDWTKDTAVVANQTTLVNATLYEETGCLAINSIPPGATVYHNGISAGVTPILLSNTPVGDHVISLVLANYNEWTDTIQVVKSDTVEVNAVLVRQTGKLSVISTPAGAAITLDGVSTSFVTPYTFDSVATGSHTVKLELSGYNTWTGSTYVYANQTATVNATLNVICPGEIVGDLNQPPSIDFIDIHPGDGRIYGVANNIDASKVRVVLWALTNMWYVQPLIASPYTVICADGSWNNWTHGWSTMVALLVDSTYVPGSTRITHPGLDPGVLAFTEYPPIRPDLPIIFAGRQWGIKQSADRFDPGPNYWSGSMENIWMENNQLHMKIVYTDGKWTCPEVYLLQSLGYGVYTFEVASRVDSLDPRAVLGCFLYESLSRELDIEFSQALASPSNAQFVVQPYTHPGNITRYDMPAVNTLTCQIEWRADHVQFSTWRGYSQSPDSLISTWNYTGDDIPPENVEHFRFNLWLFGGNPPATGIGDEVVINSFTWTP